MKSRARVQGVLRGAFALAVAAVVPFGAGCGRPVYIIAQPTAPPASPELPASSVTRHVVVVSIDGLRPDAIGAFAAPTLQRLVRDGSSTLLATTITPSKTLPSHTSMLTGEPPDRHHVLWNNVVSADAEHVEVPTVFGVARARGYRTAAFFSKSKFQPLQLPGTLDYSQAPGGWFGRWTSDRTVTDVETYLKSASPGLLFVHLGDPDRAGHADGWMSRSYGAAVGRADAAVSRIIAAADTAFGAGAYALIVTADHGGHGNDHGSADPRDVTIPWIAWGQGVKPGSLPGNVVRTMDTASTVLWLLGVSEPSDWQGNPVASAFVVPAAVTANTD